MSPCKRSTTKPIDQALSIPNKLGIIIEKKMTESGNQGILINARLSGNGITRRELAIINIDQMKNRFLIFLFNVEWLYC
jgi:hypothetical protein